MYSISLAASADLVSDSKERACEPSRSASASLTSKRSLQSTGPVSPAMTTCELSQNASLCLMSGTGSTLSVVASPAKTLALQAEVKDSPANDQVCGASTPELLTRFDRDSSSWKMWQLSETGDCQQFSATWPRSGMTRNGIAYRLPPLALATDATASGLLPTLSKRDSRTMKGGRDRPGRRGGKSLLQTMLSLGHTSGYLSPRWAEWFMGFPNMWTQLEPSAMPSSRKSRKSSGEQS